jgi:D-glycero-D-manno-heptose 1,7-bisphosphate phosphatase
MNRAIFLDRDGTINHEAEYLGDVKDLKLLPGAAEGIKILNNAGFLVIIISNQSGIARGYYTIEDMEKVNAELYRRLAKKGARIDAFYYCPHHPSGSVPQFAIHCACRKPAPGMFVQAIEEHNIDPTQSYAAGDRQRDLIPAINSGCKGILVQTGYGKKEQKDLLINPETKTNIKICKNLKEAAGWIAGEKPKT